MFKFRNRFLPSYSQAKEINKYNTRSAAYQLYFMPRARTNYGLFKRECPLKIEPKMAHDEK